VIAGSGWPFRPWVRVDRGGHPESCHEGALVVTDDAGEVRLSWGDPSVPVFVRSSLKMIQALPVVETGAADAFALEPADLAVCCASHSGEPFHVRAVRGILERAGVDEGLLHCGPHAPIHAESARELVRSGREPLPVHNNCSGKHAGMLASSARAGWDPVTYWRPEHPLQRRIRATLAELAAVPEESIAHGVDGCGVPAFRLPLERFAQALARFAAGGDAARGHGEATARIFAAMSRHPEMVGGTGRFCTDLPRACGRPLLAKGGAEGVYVAAWREDSGRGAALAVKAASGDERSRDFIVADVLHRIGILDDEGIARLARFHAAPLRNHAGDAVGRLVSLVEVPSGRRSAAADGDRARPSG